MWYNGMIRILLLTSERKFNQTWSPTLNHLEQTITLEITMTD